MEHREYQELLAVHALDALEASEAHALTESIESAIQEIAPRADITVHPEPY